MARSAKTTESAHRRVVSLLRATPSHEPSRGRVDVPRALRAHDRRERAHERPGALSRRARPPLGERRIVLTSALDPCLVAYTLAGVDGVRGAAREAAAVRPRGAEAQAHLRLRRGRVRDRRLRAHPRPADAARPRRPQARTSSGRAAASTPSSGTRRPGRRTSRPPKTSGARSRASRGARAMSDAPARPAGRALGRRGDRVGLVRGDGRGDRREALRARDRHAGRGRPRARAPRDGGVYVDATLGGGGHAEAHPRGRAAGARVIALRSRPAPRSRPPTSASAPVGDRVDARAGDVRAACASELDALGVDARRRARAPTSA